MANRLAMADIHAILKLHESGCSGHKISALLHVDRGTVSKYVAAGSSGPAAAATQAPEHIPLTKVSAVERGTDALLRQVASIGPNVQRWSEAMTQARGVEGVRVLVGLKAQAARHDSQVLGRACETALSYGAYRLHTIRQLLDKHAAKQTQFDKHAAKQTQFDFLDEIP